MKRKLPRKLRRQSRIAETITGNWVFAADDVKWVDANDSIVYFDASATTVTFPAESFSGFSIGDVITISGRGNEKVKKKKKVHVARRRKQEKQDTHTITDISTTTMTIATNGLLTATKISDTSWSVSGDIS